ncbi:copper homeostasis protein CutC [Pseudoroseicyclus tamaricis]|uniref:PF03932 family protein CutC n=1 Tax=Pseudoroseicyclus tamaricis TaxID=2705421 RepID=A0A6B2JXI5_9RHOB|nr:copper homeostasis protein CutC [Pseudoroseicyclus tamaricis]NDV02575.1 copper homeostasis protein CutC [Pseudoroseicyclus tamaricis]
MNSQLEIAVDSPAGLAAAIQGGADRIELCAALEIGGLTASAGMMVLAAESPVPVMALIRPAPGSFELGLDEEGAALADIASAREAGLAGVVIGASLADGRLDAAVLARLVEAAEGMEVALHRAFDLVPDQAEAIALCRRLGITRILTSGGAPRAVDGLPRLREALRLSAGSPALMPGGGVRAETAAQLLTALPGCDLHASCAEPADPQARLLELGFATPGLRVTSAEEIRRLKRAMADLQQVTPHPR